MKRGEIWTASGGRDYAGKPRPVLIVQDDAFEETGSVTICLLTSHGVDAPLFRPAIEPNPTNGLRERSWAMVDKITTVPRARLGDCLGTLTAGEIAQINRAMILFLGLAAPARA
ncbi:MAG TPA: type II toxin-antitoxin system PemK/MazF family toxin [Allosphingosinicella sp.]